MNELKLSKRLEAVAALIPRGSKLADIGSDHAYLPAYSFLNGFITFAIAGEVVDGPYHTAKNQIERLQLTEKIKVRKGNGLEVVHSGEVDVITICGMGGALIASILEEGKDKLSNIKRLILQPNISSISVRKWLIDNNWSLIQEEILEEDEKIYEILVAERTGNPLVSYTEGNLEKELLLGPFLSKEKNPSFIKKWTAEKKNWERILKQMKEAKVSDELLEKMDEVRKNIHFVEEEIK
ncbi:tRNA (adenine(22)-N(1))-methyltransferase [Bacillus salitolerans]|uniref:tRNA (Adenine(22)-N(1))-methyltransferase n=1 Tax=Bacillus salitolerans TaxID=1437434 RepID=A0ABW4LNY3_9BACI